MKKYILIFIIFVILVCGVFGSMYYKDNYSIKDYYYTKIVSEGEKIDFKTDSGEQIIDYRYVQDAYSESGDKLNIEFNGNKDRPLKVNAYLKLSYNENKGVVSWEEVSKEQVPKKAIKNLN